MYRRSPATEVHIGRKILCLEFGPFLWCSNLLVVATKDSIGIYDLCLPEGETAFPARCPFIEEWPVGEDFNCGIISFSPLQKPFRSKRIVSIACADLSKSVFRYYGYNETGWVDFFHHQSVVNDIAVEPITGDVIASVEDEKAVISSLDNRVVAEFHLKSPGIGLSWHESEVGKIIVGEKSGLVTLYDTREGIAVQSFDCHAIPLKCIKWCPANNILIGGVTENKWFIYNINTSQLVEEGELAHEAASFRFSNVDETIYVVRNMGGTVISIIYRNLSNVDCDGMPEGNCISFHAKCNYFAVDGPEKIFVVEIYDHY